MILTRTTDVDVPLAARAQLARDAKADLFLSIHHNATADRSANFPILYYHGHASENAGSVALGRCLGRRLRKALFASGTPVSLCSDYVLFPNAGCAVLRESYGIPGILGEASFFTNAEEEKGTPDVVSCKRELANSHVPLPLQPASSPDVSSRRLRAEPLDTGLGSALLVEGEGQSPNLRRRRATKLKI